MRKKILASVCGLLVIGMLAGACQPKPNGEIADTVIEGGGSLSLYGIDPLTLDPAVSSEMTSHEHVVKLFSGLVRLDENLEPAPDIAEKWDVSGDGRTYTFELRHDVVFHDGTKVTTADIVYSWERAAAPETGSLTAATYLGDIVGVDDVLAGRSRQISGVRVVDEYKLEVTIDSPRPYFLFKLAYPTAFVVDRANVAAGGEWWRRPNGTGPFKLGRWDQNELFVLERNERHHDSVPKLESVVFHLWAGIPMNLYETGEIDVTGVSLSYIDRVTDEAGPFYNQLMIVPELSFSYIGFNTTKPPFDDVYVRRAFSQAVDKEKLAALVYRGMVETANGILPPGIPGFNEDLEGLGFDVAAARESLSRSRYGSASALPPITITTSGWGGAIGRDLEAIIEEWRRNLGVEVKVRQLEPARFLYHLKEEADEMYSIGWVADYPHPQDFLDILFHSGMESNFGGYSNPAVDALLEAAGTDTDYQRSLATYREIERMLVEDAACLPLWFGQNYLLVKPYVTGYRLDAQGFARLSEVSVER